MATRPRRGCVRGDNLTRRCVITTSSGNMVFHIRTCAAEVKREITEYALAAAQENRIDQQHCREISSCYRLKNSTNTGACAFAFTLCVCPSSVRYCAFG